MEKHKESVIDWELDIKNAIYDLKRIAGCIPLSYKAEDEACEILYNFNKSKYNLVDIFKALMISCKKHNEKVDTKCLRTTVPYSKREIDNIFRKASKNIN